jgi:hypothetical protein
MLKNDRYRGVMMQLGAPGAPPQLLLDRTFHLRVAKRPREVLFAHEGAPPTLLRNIVCAELQEQPSQRWPQTVRSIAALW